MSKPPKRHTAIERYVFDKVSKVIAIYTLSTYQNYLPIYTTD